MKLSLDRASPEGSSGAGVGGEGSAGATVLAPEVLVTELQMLQAAQHPSLVSFRDLFFASGRACKTPSSSTHPFPLILSLSGS